MTAVRQPFIVVAFRWRFHSTLNVQRARGFSEEDVPPAHDGRTRFDAFA